MAGCRSVPDLILPGQQSHTITFVVEGSHGLAQPGTPSPASYPGFLRGII